MSRFYKYALAFMVIAATLACGLISSPLSQAQNLVSTAQSVASNMPVQTLEALPSAMPDVSGYLNPVGAPVSDWNNIPVMPQATAGQEFNKNTYSYKASGVAVADAQTFYNDKLKTLGWTSPFSAQGGTQGGIMLFTKGNNVLSVTITTGNTSGIVVILFYQ